MRDITDRRREYDHWRAELLAAWSGVYDVDRAARANLALQELLKGEPVNLIDQDRAQRLEDAVDRGESIRKIMDLVGVAKGTVQRVLDRRKGNRVDHPPTADQVAIAIIAACRETGGDPLDVAAGVRASGGPQGRVEVSRARAYAALAIRAIFEENKASSIARWVSAGSPECYIGTIDHQLKHGKMKWWSNDAFMRVVEAVEDSV